MPVHAPFSNLRTRLRAVVPLAAVLMLAACQTSSKLTIRRTRDGQELNSYRIRSLTGIRDGDKLMSEVVMADPAGTLTMQMKFQIGVPTKLEQGNYVWQKQNAPQIQGLVKASSVIFQGGQDSPAALGGSFQLVPREGDIPLYEVHMPATQMDRPGKH